MNIIIWHINIWPMFSEPNICMLKKSVIYNYKYHMYFFNGRILQLLHNLGVLNSSLSNNILYLVTFTFKLAKHKMLIKPCIFHGSSHTEAQFMVSGRFLFAKFISSVCGKKWPLFDLQIQYVRGFLIFSVTIPLNMLKIIRLIWSNLVD